MWLQLPQEQSQGVAQVNIAVGQIDKVTQSNAANAEECAKSGEELKIQSDTIQEMVEGLNDLIGNNIQTQSHSSATPSEQDDQNNPSGKNVGFNRERSPSLISQSNVN